MWNKTFFIALILSGSIFQACQDGDKTFNESKGNTSHDSSSSGRDSLILIDRTQIEVAGIRWGVPGKLQRPDGQRVFGEWVMHPEHIAEVHSITGGRVKAVACSLNQQVARGNILVEVESPDLIALQREYLEKKSQAVFLGQELVRMSALGEGGVTALKNLQKIESEKATMDAALAALKADLLLYGISAEQVNTSSISGTYLVRAPQAGKVTETAVSVGQWLEPGTRICQIRDLKKVHADLFFFPEQLSGLRPGQIFQAFPGEEAGKSVQIRVSSIDETIDPEKKALRVHAVIQGPYPHKIIEGGFLSARMEWSSGTGAELLPVASVRRDGTGVFVLLLENEHSTSQFVAFRKLYVEVLHQDDRFVAIRNGALHPDQEVVLEGAYYVDAQSRVAEFAGEE